MPEHVNSYLRIQGVITESAETNGALEERPQSHPKGAFRTIYSYDRLERVAGYSYWLDSRLDRTVSVEYTDGSQISSVSYEYYFDSNPPRSRDLYEYNVGGRLEYRERDTGGGGVMDYRETFLWTDARITTLEIVRLATRATQWVQTLRYNEEGLMEEATVVDGTGRLAMRERFSYTDGLLTRHELFRDGAVHELWEYRYDLYGRVTSETSRSAVVSGEVIVLWDYAPDCNGGPGPTSICLDPLGCEWPWRFEPPPVKP